MTNWPPTLLAMMNEPPGLEEADEANERFRGFMRMNGRHQDIPRWLFALWMQEVQEQAAALLCHLFGDIRDIAR